MARTVHYNLCGLKISLFLCGIFLSPHGMAQTCPPIPPVRETYSEQATTTAVRSLGNIYNTTSSQVIKTGQIEVLSRYPQADQLVVNLTILSIVCQSMVQERLSPDKFRREMESLREEIIRPATAMRPKQEPLVQSQYADAVPNRRPVNRDTGVSSSSLNWSTTFINSPPSIITDENRYFLVVASPNDENEANNTLRRMYNKFPNASFVLYPPYQNNSHYAVMAATWVSLAQAMLVKKRGEEMGFPTDMYLWRCPGDENSC